MRKPQFTSRNTSLRTVSLILVHTFLFTQLAYSYENDTASSNCGKLAPKALEEKNLTNPLKSDLYHDIGAPISADSTPIPADRKKIKKAYLEFIRKNQRGDFYEDIGEKLQTADNLPEKGILKVPPSGRISLGTIDGVIKMLVLYPFAKKAVNIKRLTVGKEVYLEIKPEGGGKREYRRFSKDAPLGLEYARDPHSYIGFLGLLINDSFLRDEQIGEYAKKLPEVVKEVSSGGQLSLGRINGVVKVLTLSRFAGQDVVIKPLSLGRETYLEIGPVGSKEKVYRRFSKEAKTGFEEVHNPYTDIGFLELLINDAFLTSKDKVEHAEKLPKIGSMTVYYTGRISMGDIKRVQKAIYLYAPLKEKMKQETIRELFTVDDEVYLKIVHPDTNREHIRRFAPNIPSGFASADNLGYIAHRLSGENFTGRIHFQQFSETGYLSFGKEGYIYVPKHKNRNIEWIEYEKGIPKSYKLKNVKTVFPITLIQRMPIVELPIDHFLTARRLRNKHFEKFPVEALIYQKEIFEKLKEHIKDDINYEILTLIIIEGYNKEGTAEKLEKEGKGISIDEVTRRYNSTLKKAEEWIFDNIEKEVLKEYKKAKKRLPSDKSKTVSLPADEKLKSDVIDDPTNPNSGNKIYYNENGNIWKVVDPDGNIWDEYVYNDSGELKTVKLRNIKDGEAIINMKVINHGISDESLTEYLYLGVEGNSRRKIVFQISDNLIKIIHFYPIGKFNNKIFIANHNQGTGLTVLNWIARFGILHVNKSTALNKSENFRDIEFNKKLFAPYNKMMENSGLTMTSILALYRKIFAQKIRVDGEDKPIDEVDSEDGIYGSKYFGWVKVHNEREDGYFEYIGLLKLAKDKNLKNIYTVTDGSVTGIMYDKIHISDKGQISSVALNGEVQNDYLGTVTQIDGVYFVQGPATPISAIKKKDGTIVHYQNNKEILRILPSDQSPSNIGKQQKHQL